MITHKNFLTDTQISNLQEIFNEYASAHKLAFKYWIDHEETIREVFHCTEKRIVQQERKDVRAEPVGQHIRELMSSLVELPTDTNVWLVRSHNPIGIHVDADEIKNQHGRTFLIPLTFDERIKTIVWDRVSTMNEFNQFAQAFAADPAQFVKVNNLSSELLLNNCWFGNPSIVDYINIEGIATWEPGTVIEFNREKLHASNNYTVFVPYKDYILIHTDE
jgi:hypothetical protein